MKRFMNMVKSATVKQKIIMAVIGLTTVTSCSAGLIYYANHKNNTQIEKNGFYNEGDDLVYKDEDGEKLTGFQNIDGITYYFNEDGTLATGETKIDGKTYNFTDDGKLILESGQEAEIVENDGKTSINIIDHNKNNDSKEEDKTSSNDSSDKNSNSDSGKDSSTNNTNNNTSSNSSNSGSTSKPNSSGSSSSNSTSSNNSTSSGSGSNSNSNNTSSNNSSSNTSNNTSGNQNTSSGNTSSNTGSSNGSSQSKPSTGTNNSTANDEKVETQPSVSTEEKKTIYKPSDVKWTATKADTSKWWVGKSESEIKAKVTGAMVWLNEITGEVYYGINSVKFGWNQDNIMNGGLVLISNPYNVILPCNFTGGRTAMIATNNFHIYWNLPEGTLDDGISKTVDLGSFTIKKPAAKSNEEITNYYY